MLTRKSSLYCLIREEPTISAWSYFLITFRMCLVVKQFADQTRVVGDSSYCKVMQCVTSCRQSIMQCEHSSDWMLPQIVVQCENNSDPTTLKIMHGELGIRETLWCFFPEWICFWTNHLSQWFNDPFIKTVTCFVSKGIRHFKWMVSINDSMNHSLGWGLAAT